MKKQAGTKCRPAESIQPSLFVRGESERVAMRFDLATRRRREMRPEHNDIAIRVFFAERAPGLFRHRTVAIETVVPFRIRALHRVMHQVAGDHGLLPLRRNSHAMMSRSVAGSRLEPNFIGDAMG